MNTDLETWLQDKFAQMRTALGRTTPLSSLRIGPPLAEWEASFFRRGLAENLFWVDELGDVRSDLLRPNDATGDLRAFVLKPGNDRAPVAALARVGRGPQ